MDERLTQLTELGVDVGEAQSLAELTPEQIEAAETALRTAYDEAREAKDLDTAEAIVAGIEALKAESQTREEAAAAAEAKLTELDARIAEPEAVEPEPEPEAEPEPEPEEKPQAVAASAPKPKRKTSPMPVSPKTPPAQQTSGLVAHAIVAAASKMPGFEIGQAITDKDTLAEAVAAKVDSVVRMPGGQAFVPIAAVKTTFPEERRLGTDPRENREKLEVVMASMHVTSPEELTAVTAAGGLCAPVSVTYDQEILSEESRPIRDALPRFNADRGGVQGIRPPVLSSLTGAVDVFTEAEDTSGPTKPCLDVTCGAEYEDLVDAVTKCLEIGNWNRRFFRELFDSFWNLAGAQHAREAEVQLWDRMVALSTDHVAGADAATELGAYRQLIAFLTRARAMIVSRDRTMANRTFRVVLPSWIPDYVGIDVLRQQPGDSTYAWGEAELRRDLAARNIVATFSPDIQMLTLPVDGQAVPLWPDTVEALLYPEGTFAFLDGGELNFGMEIRDSTLNTSNDVRSMTETFEGVTRNLPRSLHLTFDLCASGRSSLPVAYDPCGVGS